MTLKTEVIGDKFCISQRTLSTHDDMIMLTERECVSLGLRMLGWVIERRARDGLREPLAELSVVLTNREIKKPDRRENIRGPHRRTEDDVRDRLDAARRGREARTARKERR